jgi:hypothetical protein
MTTAPHIIDPRAIYTLESARNALGLAKGCLPREIRLGRLRVAKRAGKYLILGSWLLAWVAEGEVVRRTQVASGEPNCVTDNGFTVASE